MLYTPEMNRAFGLGSDARLSGLPESVNPYRDPQMDAERRYWIRGYRHLARYWASEAAPGRVVRRLPEVHTTRTTLCADPA